MTLSSESNVLIAANTVTINNGIVVTIAGDDGANAFVFTNVPNYTGSGGNDSTTGTFAGNGAQTLPLDQAPPFDDLGAPDAPGKGSTTSGGTTAPTPDHKSRFAGKPWPWAGHDHSSLEGGALRSPGSRIRTQLPGFGG